MGSAEFASCPPPQTGMLALRRMHLAQLSATSSKGDSVLRIGIVRPLLLIGASLVILATDARQAVASTSTDCSFVYQYCYLLSYEEMMNLCSAWCPGSVGAACMNPHQPPGTYDWLYCYRTEQ